MEGLWNGSPDFVRGYAAAVRALAQPRDPALVASVLEGIAARLEEHAGAGLADVVADALVLVDGAPAPEPPPEAAAPEPKKPGRAWSPEQRAAAAERMRAMRAAKKPGESAVPPAELPVAALAGKEKRAATYAAKREAKLNEADPGLSSEDLHEARDMLAKGKGARELHE